MDRLFEVENFEFRFKLFLIELCVVDPVTNHQVHAIFGRLQVVERRFLNISGAISFEKLYEVSDGLKVCFDLIGNVFESTFHFDLEFLLLLQMPGRGVVLKHDQKAVLALENHSLNPNFYCFYVFFLRMRRLFLCKQKELFLFF